MNLPTVSRRHEVQRDHPLAPQTIGRLPTGRYRDSLVRGLYLQVNATGTRSWILRVRVPGGARKDRGLGAWPTVGMADARKKARVMRDRLRAGDDPVQQARQMRVLAVEQQERRRTFRQCAEAYIERKKRGWTNPKSEGQWRSSLEAYVYPMIGDKPISEVAYADVTAILEPIWYTKTETASRVRSRLEMILGWAAHRKYRAKDNPAHWKGNLEFDFDARQQVIKVVHMPSLPPDRIPEFLRDLRRHAGLGAKALEFAILTAARSGEVRGATWGEIRLREKMWVIPAERMKAKRPHRVLLNDAALAVLTALPGTREPAELVFPGSKGTPLSDMTLTKVIQRMNRERAKSGRPPWMDESGAAVTVHGFRASFSTWRASCTMYPREMGEFALAHRIADKVEEAYQRGDMVAKRRQLMADWCAACEGHPLSPYAAIPSH